MNHPIQAFPVFRLFGVVLIWVILVFPLWGDIVILKDGHVLEGKVRRESFTEFDPVSK